VPFWKAVIFTKIKRYMVYSELLVKKIKIFKKE